MALFPGGIRALARAFCSAERGNVALTCAIAAIPLFGLMGAALDYTRANSVKTALQAALDATAMMLATNPSLSSMSQADLNAAATAKFNAIFNRPYAYNISITPSYSAQPPTVTLTGSATIGTTLLSVININTLNVDGSTTVTFAPPKALSINIVFDTSGSMIVGATPADVDLIGAWVTANWSKVKPNDPPPNYPDGDTPVCAFACHDRGAQTNGGDMQQGLDNAHSAGATTRFDVMISAAQQLINHLKSESQSPAHQNDVFDFNIFSFDTTLHQYGGKDVNFNAALGAINSVKVGMDTYLSTAMSSLITQMGQQGTGASASSPLKFVVLITDGLQSDRNANWNCAYWGYDAVWNWPSTCFGSSPYPNVIQASQCNQLKNNGIILAILETPYVPLTGQDPGHPAGSGYPYEGSVRRFIYPNGPNTSSAVSAALSTCASPGYYFQASDSSQIAAGFLSLTDKFVSAVPYISK